MISLLTILINLTDDEGLSHFFFGVNNVLDGIFDYGLFALLFVHFKKTRLFVTLKSFMKASIKLLQPSCITSVLTINFSFW